MAYGWAGRIVRADLSSGQCLIEQVPVDLLSSWLGGRGLGVAVLREYAACETNSDVWPLVVACGPLCGTGIPTTSRCVLTGRSPLTGTIFSSSCGGSFAWQLRAAGFDALLVTGTSPQPVMLCVTPDGARLQAAQELWGLSTDAVFGRLSAGAAVAAIGPAGENGVLYASLETADGEPFGRGGFGAVLGQRGLKAITISGGCDVAAVADPTAFDKALQDLQRLFLASPFLYGPFGIREYGTVALMDLLLRRRMVPANNFRSLLAGEALNAASLARQYAPRGSGCYDCPVACKRTAVDGQPLPDYDQLAALAGCCHQAECAELVAACRCCSRLGIDPVSAAGSLAAWSEITGTTFSGSDLQRLLVAIANRQGEGALLAAGAKRLARELGVPAAAMTVKGLELPPYDPRAACGLALAYAVSPHGGTHLDAWPLASEVLRKPVPTDPASFDGKARVIALAEEANAAMDSLVFCRFASSSVELEECAALLAAVTGECCGPADLLTVGGRVIAAEREFNQRGGFVAADDRLPERFFSQAPGVASALDRQRFELELQRYQRIRTAGKAP